MTGKRLWTNDEDMIIHKMVSNRAALQDIDKMLTDGIFQTVEKKISRLKLHCRQTKKKIFPTIQTEKSQTARIR